MKDRCASTAGEPLVTAADAGPASAIVPPEPSRELVDRYCTHEWAVHLDDVMIRRTSWHYYMPDRAALSDQVADWMGDALGWDAARRAAERDRYRQIHS